MHTVQDPIIPMVGDLIRQSPGTISLGQGVVYYDPPPEIWDQLQQFGTDPKHHRYGSVPGMSALRAQIVTKLAQENGIHLQAPDPDSPPDQDRVVVTAGSNMGFMNAVLAITSPGDQILLQVPYYFNHEMAIRMADCEPILVPTDSIYQLQPEAIAAAITPRTRAIVTISPNNPTGAVYPRADLYQINRLCQDRGIYHIHDEAYEYFTYDGAEHVSPGSFPDSQDHTISLFSLSKTYGFASWRIGYMVIPSHLFDPIRKIQDTILICPPLISQFAALAALQVGRSYCEAKLTVIRDVRQIVLQALEPIRSIVETPPAQGAFYCLLKLDTPRPSIQIVKELIARHRVAVIPGSTFGLEQGCYLRVAYGALDRDTATTGIGRLVEGLDQILNS